MIVYFADRKFNILGQASTGLPSGLAISSDTKIGDVESGISVFECKIEFDNTTRAKVETCTEVGNFVLRKNDGEEDELYTIIDAEINTKKQTVYIYAEDAGLDLLNEIVACFHGQGSSLALLRVSWAALRASSSPPLHTSTKDNPGSDGQSPCDHSSEVPAVLPVCWLGPFYSLWSSPQQ